MRKLPQPRFDMENPPDRRRRRARLAIALGVALAPFVYESSLLCAARWRALYGPVVHVDTPFLDSAGGWLDAVCTTVLSRSTDAFHNVPWRPAVVLPLAFAWALCGCWILRRRH